MNRINKILFLLGVCSLGISASICAAAAASELTSNSVPNAGEFTIYPTYYHGSNSNWLVDKLAPGSDVTEFVTVENLTNKNLSLKVSFQEATEKNGSFTPNENTDFKNIGNWISLKTTNITLAPFQKQMVPVEINIPEQITKGQYLGSIYASSSFVNSQNINIVTRIGTRVYLTVEPAGWLKTDVFDTGSYKNSLFLILSTVGFAATILLNLIYFVENRRYEKAKI